MSDQYPEGFDPDDLAEILEIFEAVDETGIYTVQFEIDTYGAAELVHHWRKAIQGNRASIVICISEMGQIITALEQKIIGDY